MGGSILSGLQSGSDVAQLLGSSGGSNITSYAAAGQGTAIAGTGAAIGAQISTFLAGGSSVGSAATAAAAFTTAGIVTAAIGAVLIIVSRIFKGANPYQVPSTKIDEAFESALQNFKALAFGGYMTRAEAATAYNVMLRMGQTYYDAVIQKLRASNASSYELQPFLDGKNHYTAVVTGDLQHPYSEAWPETNPPKPWNASAAESLYIPANTSGWYADSLQAGAVVTTEYMTEIRKTAAQKAVDALKGAASTPAGILKIGAVGAGLWAAAHFLL